MGHVLEYKGQNHADNKVTCVEPGMELADVGLQSDASEPAEHSQAEVAKRRRQVADLCVPPFESMVRACHPRRLLAG
jgi:hypothetical protein